jgi:long-chain acyl-CoA synthetase
MIVTPEGLNIHPEDVEKVLNALPEVRESAVIGSDHVHAVLILEDPHADVETLIRRANDRLETHQRIRSWSLWPFEDFPRTPSTLKIKRHEISASAQGAGDTSQTHAPDISAMSSLERVELLSDLENRYRVELDEESFSKLRSTGDLEDWLRRSTSTTTAAREDDPALSEWARSSPFRLFRAAFQHGVAMPLYRHYLPLTVTGLEHLAELKPPVLFAANHTSHLDVPTIYTALPHSWHRVLAPAMMKDHFRAYFEPAGHSFIETAGSAIAYYLACSLYNAYPLPQQMPGTRAALAYTAGLVNRGYCPIVFPEGLRTEDGTMRQFRPGIGMMAVRLRVPIVPIRIRGLYEIYSLHDSWPRRGPIHISIGPPLFFPSDTKYEDAVRQLEEVVNSLE